MPTPKVRSVRIQRDAMRAYLRTLQSNYARAVKEFEAALRRHKTFPLERHLRIRRCDEARDLLKLGESCLAALNDLGLPLKNVLLNRVVL